MVLFMNLFINLKSGSNLILSPFRHASLKAIREPSLVMIMKKLTFQMINKVESINVWMNGEEITCLKSDSNKIIRKGTRKSENLGQVQRYQCKDCKYRFSIYGNLWDRGEV